MKAVEDLDRWLAASPARRWGLAAFLALWLAAELWWDALSLWSVLVAAILAFVLWRILRLPPVPRV